MKFYAVKKGRKPGIYHNWPDAQAQVSGYSGAVFKSFDNMMDAVNFIGEDPADSLAKLQTAEDELQAAIQKIQQGGAGGASARPSRPAARSGRSAGAVRSAGKLTPISHYGKDGQGPYPVHVYTDGGCRNTGNVSGGHVKETDKAAWAYLILDPDDQRHPGHGGWYGATNNVMEMTAFLESLKKLEELGLANEEILFSLDSKYVLESASSDFGHPAWLTGWKKRGFKNVKNADLWREIDQELRKFPHLHFEWVRGHENNEGNNFVDSYLNEYMDQM